MPHRMDSLLDAEDLEAQMSRMGEHVREQQEAEAAKEYLKWFEGRSIEPIKKEEKRPDESKQKFINDETLPF